MLENNGGRVGQKVFCHGSAGGQSHVSARRMNKGAAVRLPPPHCIVLDEDDNRLRLLPGRLQRYVRAAGDLDGHL
jgi:hypothetical protein